MVSKIGYTIDETVRCGIVLRSFPEKSRITILDRFFGKQTALCFQPPASGSCIVYERSGQGNQARIVIREIIQVPLILARNHLIFLHKLFEICEVSLPLESSAHDVFALLMWVCSDMHAHITERIQDFILAKLFVLLGLHTSYSVVCEACIILIHTTSVDTLYNLALDSKCVEQLKSWLYHCISEQLAEQNLKTRIFFKKE